ncbi:MAG TPA: STING domain-containing protein [Parafilimonas sp.]|nr:STING domain-containing protein [Parafilimonas sp.]
MATRKRIFIGSSSEELQLANTAKQILETEFDVTLWNDRIWDVAAFRINQNFLSDLLKASLKFDFGVLLGTTDDRVIYHETEVLQPRDNILFELGLFIGRLGLSKCAFVIEKDLKLLSDLQGITLAKFDKADANSFVDAVSQVKNIFLNSSDNEVNFFPSATLAAVYFENLISPTCKYLIENDGFDYNQVKYTNVKLKIIIPDRITTDLNLKFERLKRKFSGANVSFSYAGRPRNITLDTHITDETLGLIDFPTIISGINFSISNLLPNEFNQLNTDYDLIVERELNRFMSTLKMLLFRNGYDDMVMVIREADV